jgi:hypothetical protein
LQGIRGNQDLALAQLPLGRFIYGEKADAGSFTLLGLGGRSFDVPIPRIHGFGLQHRIASAHRAHH